MAAPEQRQLAGEVRVTGMDHEDWTENEFVDASRSVRQVLHPLNPDAGVPIAPVKWGGECRVEVDCHAAVVPPAENSINIWGEARFYEGASEDTGEKEDSKPYEFHVPKTYAGHLPTTYHVHLRNSTVVGEEDYADVWFSLSNDRPPELPPPG
ncbi:hypothetical protein [Streptomyces mutabilis]|uniref:hypothetical protein n=1 Tax=Streptomyces mutabilis TaxID=67332 RepID=UPI0036A67E91